jgi:hypothetical protein
MLIRIAIVGSRDYPDMKQVRDYVDTLCDDVIVISGGARGVDRIAETQARQRGLRVKIYHAEWERFGKSAGYRRNADIVANSDMVVAFWDGHSRGTAHTIKLAKRDGTPTHVFMGDEEIIITDESGNNHA